MVVEDGDHVDFRKLLIAVKQRNRLTWDGLAKLLEASLRDICFWVSGREPPLVVKEKIKVLYLEAPVKAMPALPPLSDSAKLLRTPPPPEFLVGATHEPVYSNLNTRTRTPRVSSPRRNRKSTHPS